MTRDTCYRVPPDAQFYKASGTGETILPFPKRTAISLAHSTTARTAFLLKLIRTEDMDQMAEMRRTGRV